MQAPYPEADNWKPESSKPGRLAPCGVCHPFAKIFWVCTIIQIIIPPVCNKPMRIDDLRLSQCNPVHEVMNIQYQLARKDPLRATTSCNKLSQ
jgi:hypothetical protein